MLTFLIFSGCSISVVRVHGVHVGPVRFQAARPDKLPLSRYWACSPAGGGVKSPQIQLGYR